jgi:cytochrome c553
MRTIRRVAAIALLAPVSAAAQQPAFEIPKWAFPTLAAEVPSSVRAGDTTVRSLAHSKRSFRGAQLTDLLNPPDWHPESHPPAPAVVLHARSVMKYACGLCHLPDGQGRSENATIAGLPADYIRRQVDDILAGKRASAAEFGPSARMRDVVVAATDAEVADAANYFASIRPRRQYTVVEATSVPRTYQAGGLYARRGGGETEPLGDRMMEISDDIEHHEMRDPNETFTVYVQPGTLAKGRRLAITARADSPTRSATCHGADLRGGTAGTTGPPIAGKSPLYLLRQLVGFRTKARNGAMSAPMQLVTNTLSLDAMIAAAAYAGSRAP